MEEAGPREGVMVAEAARKGDVVVPKEEEVAAKWLRPLWEFLLLVSSDENRCNILMVDCADSNDSCLLCSTRKKSLRLRNKLKSSGHPALKVASLGRLGVAAKKRSAAEEAQKAFFNLTLV